MNWGKGEFKIVTKTANNNNKVIERFIVKQMFDFVRKIIFDFRFVVNF